MYFSTGFFRNWKLACNLFMTVPWCSGAGPEWLWSCPEHRRAWRGCRRQRRIAAERRDIRPAAAETSPSGRSSRCRCCRCYCCSKKMKCSTSRWHWLSLPWRSIADFNATEHVVTQKPKPNVHRALGFNRSLSCQNLNFNWETSTVNLFSEKFYTLALSVLIQLSLIEFHLVWRSSKDLQVRRLVICDGSGNWNWTLKPPQKVTAQTTQSNLVWIAKGK